MKKPIVRFIFYFVCILLVGYLNHYALEFDLSGKIIFNYGGYSLYFYRLTYPLAIGILLGLIILIVKPRVDKFSYDGVMALGLGIPLAYVTFHFLPTLLFNINLPYIPSFNYNC